VHHVAARNAKVSAVANRDHADSGGQRLGNTEIHCFRRERQTKPILRIESGGGTGFVDDRECRSRVDDPGIDTADIHGQARYSVGRYAANVGDHQSLGCAVRHFGRNAYCTKYTRDETSQSWRGYPGFIVVHREN
jgi:hypothetical protein